jgi:pimeloyl-ACP methyl ester carboxylesterase
MARWRQLKRRDGTDRPIRDLLPFGRSGIGRIDLPAMIELPERTPFSNVPWPTLGGKQIWADLFIHGGWRIQSNVYTGHCRLLDRNNIRRCWGTYEHCRTVFDRQRQNFPAGVRARHIVLLIHGLGRSADAFNQMQDALRQAGYDAASVNYPSTRQGITAHATNLEHLIDALEDVDKISFVTHSLGGLVIRDMLSRDSAWKARLQVHRIVMIGPPNQGSNLAERLRRVPGYQFLTGESGRELSSGFASQLPTPDAEFGIIAGGRGNDIGFNPLLSGDDDGFVRVAETWLEGANDHMIVNTTHGLLDDHPITIESTISFLRNGCFRQDEGRAAS